jgi:TPR repeat protein
VVGREGELLGDGRALCIGELCGEEQHGKEQSRNHSSHNFNLRGENSSGSITNESFPVADEAKALTVSLAEQHNKSFFLHSYFHLITSPQLYAPIE